MGNICCPTKKDGRPPDSSTENNKAPKKSSRSKKYETNEAEELSVASPIVNGAEMPVDVPETMLVGKDDSGELRLTKLTMPSNRNGESLPQHSDQHPDGSVSVGLVNPGFSSDEDEEQSPRRVKKNKRGDSSSGTSEGAGELSRQSTVKVRADEVPEYIGQGKVTTTEVTVNVADATAEYLNHSDRDSLSSDSSAEIERRHDKLFGNSFGFSVQDHGSSDTFQTAKSSDNENQIKTQTVKMSAADVHNTPDCDTEVTNTIPASTVHTPSSDNTYLPSEPVVPHVTSDAKLQQDAIDHGYLILGDATGDHESTDVDLLDDDGVTLDFGGGSKKDSTFNLFGGPMSGHEEMAGHESIQFSINSVWEKNQSKNDDDIKTDDSDVAIDHEASRLKEPTLEEFEQAEREVQSEASLEALTNNPADKDKLLSSQTIGSERIDYSLPVSNEERPTTPTQPWGIQPKSSVMYGSDTDSDSDSDTFVTSRSVTESPIKPEMAAPKDLRSSFDLFGAAPHKDMPKQSFPVVEDTEFGVKSEQSGVESSPSDLNSQHPQNSTQDSQRSRPPLIRSPQISVEANNVLLRLDEALDADDAVAHKAKDDLIAVHEDFIVAQKAADKDKNQGQFTADGLRIIHNDLRGPDDIPDQLQGSTNPQKPSSFPHPAEILPDSEFAAESDEEVAGDSDEYDDELNLVLKDGAVMEANQTDEADRELEEIIMVSICFNVYGLFHSSLKPSGLCC